MTLQTPFKPVQTPFKLGTNPPSNPLQTPFKPLATHSPIPPIGFAPALGGWVHPQKVASQGPAPGPLRAGFCPGSFPPSLLRGRCGPKRRSVLNFARG